MNSGSASSSTNPTLSVGTPIEMAGPKDFDCLLIA